MARIWLGMIMNGVFLMNGNTAVYAGRSDLRKNESLVFRRRVGPSLQHGRISMLLFAVALKPSTLTMLSCKGL